MSRISIKINTAIILSIIFVAISIGSISQAKAITIIKEETYEKFRHISGNYSNKFSLLLTGIENTVNTIAYATEADFNIQSFSENSEYRKNYMLQTNRLLKKISQNNNYIQGIYLAFNPELTGSVYESWFINRGDGEFISQSPEDISTFYPENQDMDWYYNPVEKRRGVWSLPYTDATINIKMITYSLAIFSAGQLIGVVGIDIYFNDILKAVEEMTFYNTGYSVLLDSKYNILVHPELSVGTYFGSLENENMKDVINAFDNAHTDVISYIYNKTSKIMGFSKLSNGWVFLAVTPLKEVNRHVIKLRQTITLVMIIAVLIGAAIGLKMSSSIIRQLNKLHEMVEKISEGNYEITQETTSRDEIGNLARSFISMSHKLESLNREMEVMAYHDALTHLPNRRYGMKKLNELLKDSNVNNEISGVMFIDLDNFKAINDLNGHDAGDMILMHVSEVMNHKIGNNDLLCRVGGDEFLLIFRNVPTRNLIEALAERLLNAISEPVTFKFSDITASCSIGVAIIESGLSDEQEILKRADLAMYEAKKRGRNNYVFFEDTMK